MAAAMTFYTLPGLRFMWEGDYNGFSDPLDIHLRRETTQSPITSVQDFYDELFVLLRMPIFRHGDWEFCPVTGSNQDSTVMAWKWSYEGTSILCVVNYADSAGSGAIVIADASPVHGNDTIPVVDIWNDITYYRSVSILKTTGLFVIVNPYDYQIFQYHSN